MKTKRFLALVLALVMAFSLVVPASAETAGTILKPPTTLTDDTEDTAKMTVYVTKDEKTLVAAVGAIDSHMDARLELNYGTYAVDGTITAYGQTKNKANMTEFTLDGTSDTSIEFLHSNRYDHFPGLGNLTGSYYIRFDNAMNATAPTTIGSYSFLMNEIEDEGITLTATHQGNEELIDDNWQDLKKVAFFEDSDGDDDSYIRLAADSYITLNTEKLIVTEELELNNFSNSTQVQANIDNARSKLKLATGTGLGYQILLKQGTRFKLGNSYADVTTDLLITMTGNEPFNTGVDGDRNRLGDIYTNLTDSGKANLAQKMLHLFSYIAGSVRGTESNPVVITFGRPTEVAQIDSTKYTSLADAFAAAQNDDTIKLLTDVPLSGNMDVTLAGKTVTLNLDGHTLTGRTNLKSGNLTVTNGTISCPDGQALNVYGSSESVANYVRLDVASDVTINAGYAVCLFGPEASSKKSYGATVNFNGKAPYCTKGAIFVSGNIGDNGEMTAESPNIPVINIGAEAEITSTDQAIAMNGLAKVYVADGAKLTGREAIGVKRGILNVNGGTLTATGTKYNPADANNNGTEETGAAISVTSTYNYAGTIQVNVSGGTITSTHNAALYVGHSRKNNNLFAFQNGVTLSVTGGSFNGGDGAVYVADAITGDATMPAKFISGGTFSTKPAATYVAPGYEAVELTADNKLEGETAGWYKVGAIATTEVTKSEETAENFDATFSASKTVTSTDDSEQVLATGNTLSVNIKASGSATAETNHAASYKLEEVVEDAIGAANNTNKTALDVTIQIVSDTPAVDTSGEAPTITYEVHPEATVKSGSETVGTFIVTNDKLADNAVFTIKLPVPNAVYLVSNKIRVTHIRDELENEVFQLTAEGSSDDYFVTIPGITSFSQFELAPITNSAYNDDVKFNYTLDLQDSININFYVDPSEASDKTIGNYTVQYLYKGGEWQTAQPDPQVTSFGYRYVVAQCAAKEMTEPVHVRVLYAGAIIKSADYSVKGYCDYMIGKSSDQELIALCRSVLDFGAAAQMKFGYNTDNLATEYDPTKFDSTIIDEKYNVFNGTLGSNVTGVTGTVNLESKTGVVIYLTPESSEVLQVESVKLHDVSLTYTTSTTDNGRLKITVSGVVAYNLDNAVDIFVSDGTVIHYSPLAYAYGMRNSKTVGTLCKALFQYWVNAKAYFDAHS